MGAAELRGPGGDRPIDAPPPRAARPALAAGRARVRDRLLLPAVRRALLDPAVDPVPRPRSPSRCSSSSAATCRAGAASRTRPRAPTAARSRATSPTSAARSGARRPRSSSTASRTSSRSRALTEEEIEERVDEYARDPERDRARRAGRTRRRRRGAPTGATLIEALATLALVARDPLLGVAAARLERRLGREPGPRRGAVLARGGEDRRPPGAGPLRHEAASTSASSRTRTASRSSAASART